MSCNYRKLLGYLVRQLLAQATSIGAMTEERKTRISVLISGNGSNLQALIDAQHNTLSHCEIVRCLTNRKAAYGLIRAKNAGIPTSYHNLLEYKKKYPDSVEKARSRYDLDLAVDLLKDSPDIVVCAGFMHVLAPTFLDHLGAANVPVINLHPALPGAYNGVQAIERAHQDWIGKKVDRTGIMIHYVVAEVDMGEPIVTKEIKFEQNQDEDLETFKEKVHNHEHQIIVEGTKKAVERLHEASTDNGVR